MTDTYFDGDFTSVLKDILHYYNGQMQDKCGAYRIPIPLITEQDMIDHILGRKSVALSVCTKAKTGNAQARFIGIDIDKHFSERLPFYVAALRDLRIERSVFTTGGSTPDRGKIIITFKEMMPKRLAYQLGHLIHLKAYELSDGLLPEHPANGDLEIYPKNAENSKHGGNLRILGRNVSKDGPIELPLDLCGNSLDLAQIEPLTYGIVCNRTAGIAEDDFHAFPPHIEKLLSTSWIYEKSGDLVVINRNIQRLAYYFAIKYDGNAEGDMRYRSALQSVHSNSPNLPSHLHPSVSGDERNPLDRELETLSAWNKAVATRWRPIDTGNVKVAGSGVYVTMVEHVKKNGLFTHCFSITQKMLAELMHIRPNAVIKQLDNATKSGLIVKVDKGRPRLTIHDSMGKHYKEGLPAMYGLVGVGENPEVVLGKARADPKYLERLDKTHKLFLQETHAA